MKQTKLTDLRKNLSSLLNAVNLEGEPLLVTRRRGKPVVLMSLDDYKALDSFAPRPSKSTSTSVDGLLNSLVGVDEMTFVPKKLGDLEKT